MSDNPIPQTQSSAAIPHNRWRRRLTKWLRLSWRERLLLGEALLLLGLGRATVLFVPFKRVAPHLGVAQQETSLDISATSAQHTAKDVSKAILLASRFTPWNSNCFAQALAGHVMLRRRDHANTLYLGVRKEGVRKEGVRKEGGTLAAHAWLRHGNLIVTGKHEHETFTVITRYGWQPRAST